MLSFDEIQGKPGAYKVLLNDGAELGSYVQVVKHDGKIECCTLYGGLISPCCNVRHTGHKFVRISARFGRSMRTNRDKRLLLLEEKKCASS